MKVGRAMQRLWMIGTAAAGAVTISLPAFATTQIPIPEPTALSLIGAGIAGGVIAWRLYRRR
jgi:PEP-CTERM motif